MAVTLTLTGKTPSNTQFGLDTFSERYKCDATADEVLTDAGVPQMGDAHPDYPFMFVTGRPCSETGESASALDLIYTGCLTDDGDGNPTLPAQQHHPSDAVMSATSSKGLDGTTLTSPLSVQYYAPLNELTFFSYLSEGSLDTVADPTQGIRVISLTIGDTSFSSTGSMAQVVANFFTPLVVDTIDSPEVVATKYWQNTERKTLTLSPPIFDITSGNYIVMFAPGGGYTVGNTLTMTDGSHTAVLEVASLGLGNSIIDWTVTSNTFDYDTRGIGPIYTSGGSGSGAAFYNINIP